MSEAPERISVESDEFTLDPTQSKVNIGPIKDPIYIGEEAMMSDDLVKRICQQWIDAGGGNDCFWVEWSGCPSGKDSLTPRMVLDRIEELKANRLANRVAIMRLEAKLEKAVEALGDLADCVDDGCFCSEMQMATVMDKARTTLAELTGGKDE